MGVWLELVPLFVNQGRIQLDDGRTRLEEVDSHWALRQRRVPEQLAYEEGDDAQRGDGGATVGDEQNRARPGEGNWISPSGAS